MSVVINGTTGISGVDGTAAAPAVQGNDTNTGIFFPANDTIAFAEGGTEVMRIDANGNVGIGTSTPLSSFPVNLTLFNANGSQSSVTSTNIRGDFYSSETNQEVGLRVFSNHPLTFRTNNTERMRIDTSGRVTIPNQPFFMGQPTTDYSGGSMPTRVMDVTALYNNGGHFNNSTDRFTCPVTGWYRVTWGGLQLPSTVTSLMVNGSRSYNGNHYPAASPNYITMTQTVLRSFNAGDYLEIEQWNGGGYYSAWWLWTVELVG